MLHIPHQDIMSATCHIIGEYVAQTTIPPERLSKLISEVSEALTKINNRADSDLAPSMSEVDVVVEDIVEDVAEVPVEAAAPAPAQDKPFVDPLRSVFPHKIICLTCGDEFRMLKRHLKSEHGMTPEEYRKRYDLASDYPLVAPDHAEVRSNLAKSIGLGRTGSAAAPQRTRRQKVEVEA